MRTKLIWVRNSVMCAALMAVPAASGSSLNRHADVFRCSVTLPVPVAMLRTRIW